MKSTQDGILGAEFLRKNLWWSKCFHDGGQCMNARQNWIRTVVLGQRGVAESFSQAASLVMIGSVVGLLALLGYCEDEPGWNGQRIVRGS